MAIKGPWVTVGGREREGEKHKKMSRGSML